MTSPSSHPPRLRFKSTEYSTGSSLGSYLFPLATAALMCLLWLGMGNSWLRISLVLVLFTTFLALFSTAPQASMMAMLVFCAVLGGLRRYLIQDFGWQSYDPFLLIVPLIVLIVFANISAKRGLSTDTVLSRLIAVLLGVMCIQVLNPLQGGVEVGLGGILYYIMPLLWFYIGRQYGTLKFAHNVCVVIVGIMIFGALYGLKQMLFGFSDSERKWMSLANVSLSITATANRPFSFFPSGQEFALLLSSAIILSWTFLLQKRLLYVFPLVLLLPTLLLTGIRGSVVIAIFTCSLVWALQGKKKNVWLPRLLLALMLGVAGLAYSLTHVDASSLGSNAKATFGHQQTGLLNAGESTAPEHFRLIAEGILTGIKQPIGYGLGSTTIASGKFGGILIGAEADYANMFISLGIIGGVVYLAIIFWVFKEGIILWRQTRNVSFLLMLGLAFSCFGQWLNGGLYLASILSWLTIGMLDKQFALYSKTSGGKRKPGSKLARRRASLKFQPRGEPLVSTPNT